MFKLANEADRPAIIEYNFGEYLRSRNIDAWVEVQDVTIKVIKTHVVYTEPGKPDYRIDDECSFTIEGCAVLRDQYNFAVLLQALSPIEVVEGRFGVANQWYNYLTHSKMAAIEWGENNRVDWGD